MTRNRFFAFLIGQDPDPGSNIDHKDAIVNSARIKIIAVIFKNGEVNFSQITGQETYFGLIQDHMLSIFDFV